MKKSPLPVALLVLIASLSLHASDAPRIALPAVRHPGAGQVFYFVMTDRFANGDKSNDTGGHEGGADDHGFDPTRISHYHGGDFRGLTGKLDYIKNLGVTAIWVTPPFKNKPVQSGTAGYHGYWILDFETIDPHLGTDAEFGEFVRQAHAHGLKVYLDIVANHTADVITYSEGKFDYVPKSTAPYRDADGVIFDEHALAYDGSPEREKFPALEVDKSFAYTPVVPAAEAHAKNPAWLNDPRYYHNRGNSVFKDENSLHGDFVGLDDTFTEHPRVVRGFIEIFKNWMTRHGVDGFRIDTVKHVNMEFWQVFGPAIREHARQMGRPDFFQFGEAHDERGDASFLSEYSTTGKLDATLDFGFFKAAREFVSKAEPSGTFAAILGKDDFYTDADSNVHGQTTFIGNHDAGRFSFFVRQDNPKATEAEVLALTKLGHGLLLLSRGQPVIYYGDEQGMVGTGNDMAAREDMFPSQAKGYRELALLGTTRTGTDDKFDQGHPLYRLIATLAKLRAEHPALAGGAMTLRDAGRDDVVAFSRVERAQQVEYVAAFNRSRTERATVKIPTGSGARMTWKTIFNSSGRLASEASSDAEGRMSVTLEPMQFAVWRAEKMWPKRSGSLAVSIALEGVKAGQAVKFETREVDGYTFAVRRELRAESSGGDGLGEVTFVVERLSQPGKFEVLGTDDAPPYRVFWAKPKNWAAGERVRFIATLNDLRGGVVSAASAEILLE